MALGYERATKAIQDHVDAEDKDDEIPIRDSIGRIMNELKIFENSEFGAVRTVDVWWNGI